MSEKEVSFTPFGLLSVALGKNNSQMSALPLPSAGCSQHAQGSVCLSPTSCVHASPSTKLADLRTNVEKSIVLPECLQTCMLTQSLSKEVTDSASEQASLEADTNSTTSGSSNALSEQNVACHFLKDIHEEECAEQASSTQPKVDIDSATSAFSDTLSEQTIASHCLKGTPDKDNQDSLTQPKVDSNTTMSGSSNTLSERTVACHCLKETHEEEYVEQTSFTQPKVENDLTVSAFSDTLSKQTMESYHLKGTQEENYAENILNAWATGILALSETSRKAQNENIANLVEIHNFKGITLANKPQNKTFTSQMDSFDSTKCNFYKNFQAAPSGDCFEGKKEELCEESDSEMEMPQLSPKDTAPKELSSHVRESETQNLTIEKDVKTPERISELLEVMPSKGCSDLSTSDRDNETRSNRATLSLIEETGTVSSGTDDMLQRSSVISVLYNELTTSSEIEEIDFNNMKTCEHFKSQDSASTEPLAKRLKLESETVSKDSQEISYEQPLNITTLQSKHSLTNQEPSSIQASSVDQSQNCLKLDVCTSEPYMEPAAPVTILSNPTEGTLLEMKRIPLPKCNLSPHEPFDSPDDGSDTIGQALPTEGARMHAGIPNLARCTREFEHDSSSDESEDDCEVDQGIQELDVPGDDYSCMIQYGSLTSDCQIELPRSTISEHQIVPDEKLHNNSFSLSSLYADNVRNKLIPEPVNHLETVDQLDLESMDDTAVITLALKSIESKGFIKNTSSSFRQEQVICPQTLLKCDTADDMSTLVPCGMSRSPPTSRERPLRLLTSKYTEKGIIVLSLLMWI